MMNTRHASKSIKSAYEENVSILSIHPMTPEHIT